MKSDDLPFPLGEWAEGDSTPDTNDPLLPFQEGMEYWVEHKPANSSNFGLTSGRMKKVRLVRNNAGFAILPGRQVIWDNTANKWGKAVVGMNVVTNGFGPVADDQLPSTGVPANALFYVVIEGPVVMKTAMASLLGIAVGNALVGVTANATTGSTTAGRVQLADFTAATMAATTNPVTNFLGWALTARTTNNTDADILVDLKNHWG